MKNLQDYGIIAKIDGKEIIIGNEKLMKNKNIKYIKSEEVGTEVYIAVDGNYAGYILIADKIKEDSKQTIEELKKNKIKQTIMLTGDKKEIGEKVAEKLGLDNVYAELLPDGKVKKIEELLKERSKKGKLAFVGDGINDSPVLATADVGIAMGGLGSDAAIEASDIVIMTDEPSKVVKAIKLSRKTLKIVKENIIFAISVKIIILFISAFGLGTMWHAVFADVGVTVIAILNALRALFADK